MFRLQHADEKKKISINAHPSQNMYTQGNENNSCKIVNWNRDYNKQAQDQCHDDAVLR